MTNTKEKKDLLESLNKDIKCTVQNYSQMYAKFKMRDTVTRLLIVYYSLATIIYALLPLYFGDVFTNDDAIGFASICLSVCSLIASLMITFAKYPERTIQTMDALDNLKKLKKKLHKFSAEELREDKCKIYDKLVQEYHQIVDKVELRTDIDYYRACWALYVEGKYKEKWENLPRLNKLLARTSRALEYCFYGALLLLPVFLVFYFV